MKKKVVIIVIILIAILMIGICFWQYKENKRIDEEAVILKEDLRIEFGTEAKVSDFIENLKGSLIEDRQINTEQLGEKRVSFEYMNVKNKRKMVEFSVNVVDTNPPQIFSGNSYTVKVGYDKNLADVLLSRG